MSQKALLANLVWSVFGSHSSWPVDFALASEVLLRWSFFTLENSIFSQKPRETVSTGGRGEGQIIE